MAVRVSRKIREKMLMKLSELTKDDPGISVKLLDLADAAGITLDQAKYAFHWFLDEVFAKGNWHQDGSNANLSITVKGSDEAYRLRLPWWKRQLTREGAWFTIITGTVAGVMGGATMRLLQKLFE